MGQSRVVNKQFKFKAFKNGKMEFSKRRCKTRLRRVRKGSMSASCQKARGNKMIKSYKLKSGGSAEIRQLKSALVRSEGMAGRKRRTRRLSARLRKAIKENFVRMNDAQTEVDIAPPGSATSASHSVIEVQPISNSASTITLYSLDEVNEDENESDVELQMINCKAPIKEDEDVVIIGRPRSLPAWSITTKQEVEGKPDEVNWTDTVRFLQDTNPSKWQTAVVPQRDRPQSPLLVHLSAHLSCAFRTTRALSTIKLPPREKEINYFDPDINLDNTLTDLQLDPLDDDENSSPFACQECMDRYFQELATLADMYGIFPLDKNCFDNLHLAK